MILYDPAYYADRHGRRGRSSSSTTRFSNSDDVQHYATVGIENGDQTDGVLYTYFNAYTAGGGHDRERPGHQVHRLLHVARAAS